MYLLNNYSKQFGGFIAADSKAAIARTVGLVLITLAAIACAILHYGAPVMNGRPWDVPALLDGGWRILHGQIPYRDFFVHHGPLALYVTALGMKVSHPSVGSIDYGAVLFMAGLTIPALVLLSRRTSALYTFAFTLLVTLLIIAPRPLGDPYDFTDHAMIFTRFGEALLILLSISLFIPPLKPANAKNVTGMVFTGLLLSLLFLNKINYGLLGLGFWATAIALRSITLRQGIVALLSFVVISAIFFALTGISFREMIAAYSRVAVGFGGGYRIKFLLIVLLKTAFLLPFILLLVWESRFGAQRDDRFGSIRRWAIPLILCGGAVLLMASNTQLAEAPLLACAALYSAEAIRRDSRNPNGGFFSATRNTASLVIVLIFLLPTLLTDLFSIRHSLWLAHRNDFAVAPSLRSTPLSDLRFDPAGTRWWYSKDYMESVAEGVDLMRRHSQEGLKIMPLLFTNPFQLGLEIPPFKGGILFWDPVLFQFHNSFPPLNTLIGSANAIMISANDDSLEKAYGLEWKNLHPQQVEKTKHYILLKLATASAN